MGCFPSGVLIVLGDEVVGCDRRTRTFTNLLLGLLLLLLLSWTGDMGCPTGVIFDTETGRDELVFWKGRR